MRSPGFRRFGALDRQIVSPSRANGRWRNCVPNKDRADFSPVLESDHTIAVAQGSPPAGCLQTKPIFRISSNCFAEFAAFGQDDHNHEDHVRDLRICVDLDQLRDLFRRLSDGCRILSGVCPGPSVSGDRPRAQAWVGRRRHGAGVATIPFGCVNYDTQRCRESTYLAKRFLPDWDPSPMAGSFLRSAIHRCLPLSSRVHPTAWADLLNGFRVVFITRELFVAAKKQLPILLP